MLILELLIAITALILAGIFSYKKYLSMTISRKIADLQKEEEAIMALMKEAQEEHYKNKGSGAEAYQMTILGYSQRLSKIRQQRITLV